MKRIVLVALTLGCLLLLGAVAEAGLLPGDVNQKWEGSLDGFAYLTAATADPDGVPGSGDEFQYVVSRNLTKFDSPFKSQGNVTMDPTQPGAPPHRFRIGLDPDPPLGPGGKVSDVDWNGPSNIGVLGLLTTGLRLLSVDDTANAGISYNRLTTPAQLLAWIGGGQSDYDILYFDDDPFDASVAMGHVYHDLVNVNGDFLPGVGDWNAVGDVFDTNGVANPGGKTIGNDGADVLELQTTFQSIGNARVDGSLRAAPAGTLIANVLDPAGTMRPLLFMDVIGGASANAVLAGGIYSDLLVDPDGDGDITTGIAQQYSQRYVADLVSALAAQQAGGAWSTMSDPVEWVSTPEPASFVIWSVVLGAVFVVGRRRRVV